MTWTAFNALVRTHLTAYGRIKGIQEWIDLLIKAACIDVQRAVEFYQAGHTVTPTLTDDGFAQKAVDDDRKADAAAALGLGIAFGGVAALSWFSGYE